MSRLWPSATEEIKELACSPDSPMDRRCWLTNRSISVDIEGEAAMKRGIAASAVTVRGSGIVAQVVTGRGAGPAASNNPQKIRKTKSVNIANNGPKEPTRKLHK